MRVTCVIIIIIIIIIRKFITSTCSQALSMNRTVTDMMLSCSVVNRVLHGIMGIL